MSSTYTVTGMTCQHCVNAVTSEIGGIAGVTGVDVDLETGKVEVYGEASAEAVAAAVDEAGYQLA